MTKTGYKLVFFENKDKDNSYKNGKRQKTKIVNFSEKLIHLTINGTIEIGNEPKKLH